MPTLSQHTTTVSPSPETPHPTPREAQDPLKNPGGSSDLKTGRSLSTAGESPDTALHVHRQRDGATRERGPEEEAPGLSQRSLG